MKKTITMWAVAILAVSSLSAGCGGDGGETAPQDEGTAVGDTTTGGDETATATSDDEVPSPPKPWEEMTDDEQKQWMVAEVMPRMAELFEGYDAERFGGFDCSGCHGADAQAREFAMPNPDIMALYPSGTVEQRQMVADNRDMVVFMFEDVLPTMQTLLGESPYDEETQEGFKCTACHPSAGAGTPVEE